MRKNGFTLTEIVIATVVLVLIAFAVTLSIVPRPKKEVTATVKSYTWGYRLGYPFPPAKEFGESDHYSMVWIGELDWIKKRFLLVKVKKSHMDYGRLPFLLRAVYDVEKEGYTIVSREFLSSTTPDIIDSLLLEVRPPENTEER